MKKTSLEDTMTLANSLTEPQKRIYEKVIKFYVDEPSVNADDLLVVLGVLISNLSKRKKGF